MQRLEGASARPEVKGEFGHQRVIDLQNVTVRYGRYTVLQDVSFSVQRGEFMGVIGPNGAGKSTLLRLLLGLVKPTSGRVTVLGAPVHRGNHRIGYVPQSQTISSTMSIRARDMVTLGLSGTKYGLLLPSRADRARVDAALRDVRAETYADVPVAQLSGGQQQRLMLAQALVSDPDLLLLDEPLASLDIRSRRDMVELVDEVRHTRNVAVLFVVHDVNPLLGHMDRVLYLSGGRAVSGTPEEVIQAEVLSGLFGFPVEVVRVGGHILVTSDLGCEDCHD